MRFMTQKSVDLSRIGVMQEGMKELMESPMQRDLK